MTSCILLRGRTGGERAYGDGGGTAPKASRCRLIVCGRKRDPEFFLLKKEMTMVAVRVILRRLRTSDSGVEKGTSFKV